MEFGVEKNLNFQFQTSLSMMTKAQKTLTS